MSKQVLEAVKLALSLERGEVDYYRLASDKTCNPSGRKMFSYLADEEESHIAALEKQLEAFEGSGGWLTDEEAFDKKACRMLSSKKPEDVIPDELSGDSGDVEAVSQAIEIEKKSIAFYEDAACKVKDEKALKMFHYLIRAEKEHRKDLEMQLTFLKSAGMWLDNEVMLS
ncbi:MAG: ferritin family protein [Candidatus Altiarchaeota archaeon]